MIQNAQSSKLEQYYANNNSDLPISAEIPGPKNEANFACKVKEKDVESRPLQQVWAHGINKVHQILPVSAQNQRSASLLPQIPKPGSIYHPQ